MAILKDPEGNENTVLHAMVDFKGLNVLEIGCGDGKFTWHYARKASHVTAIDPDEVEIEKARAKIPGGLKERIDFLATLIEDYAASFSGKQFDLAIYSWSL